MSLFVIKSTALRYHTYFVSLNFPRILTSSLLEHQSKNWELQSFKNVCFYVLPIAVTVVTVPVVTKGRQVLSTLLQQKYNFLLMNLFI